MLNLTLWLPCSFTILNNDVIESVKRRGGLSVTANAEYRAECRNV